MSLDRLFDRFSGEQPDDSRSAVRDLLDAHIESRCDMDCAALPQLSTWMNERLVLCILTRRAQQKNLRGCARIAGAEQPGAKDARRVDCDRVAGRNQPREVRKAPVLERA